MQAATVLGFLALVDRMRRARRIDGEDPRLCLLAAGIFLFWAGAGLITIPGLGWTLPSPRVLIRFLIPGADAVRGLYTLMHGFTLAMAFLSGYGVLLLTRRASPKLKVAIVAAVSAFILAERFAPNHLLTTWEARPPEPEIDLLRRTSGPVVFLPYPTAGTLKAFTNARYLLLTSYSPRPTSACYYSFISPIDGQLERLANALPEPAAADALHALGFRTVVLDKPAFWRPALRRFDATMASETASRERLADPVQSERLTAYRLSSSTPEAADLSVLAVDPNVPAAASPAGVTAGHGSIELEIRNHGGQTFRHPDPIAPTDLVVRWTRPASGPDASAVVAEQHVRAMLPIALGAAATFPLTLEVDVPNAVGELVVTVAPADRPHLILAARRVDAREPSASPATSS